MSVVVKVGGAVGNATEPVLADLSERLGTVLVHGGSHEVDRLGEQLGRPSDYYSSPSGVVSRRSDPAHMEVVVLALAGRVQTALVAGLARYGVRAVGLSGVDGGLLLARRKEGARAVVDGRTVRVADDLSGAIESVNAALLQLLLGAGLMPVVGPPAITQAGEVVNVDADRVAAEVAIALHAETLLLLTNVPGLLRDPADPRSLIRLVPREEIDSALGVAEGRMRKKVHAAQHALRGGVARVVIAPSQGLHPIGRALSGEGTVFE